MMQAVRIQPSRNKDAPHSADHPPTSTDLQLDTIDIPRPEQADDIVVRVHATTVIRDTLTWPEMYARPLVIPGHDFAATVSSVHPDSRGSFKVGDQVYGMVHADRGGCWAQYVLVKEAECALKPGSLSWEEAATVPLSALTAWQALFEKGDVSLPASLKEPGSTSKDAASRRSGLRPVLVTGASGGVGVWIMQLAKLAGCHVVAGTTSKARTKDLLVELGADEVVEYGELGDSRFASRFDTVIDCVAGDVLERCWSVVKHDGTLVGIHSDSFDFVQQHRKSGVARGKDGVNALFFIVKPLGADLAVLARLIDHGKLKTFVAETYPLADIRKVYDLCHNNSGPKGKAVLTP